MSELIRKISFKGHQDLLSVLILACVAYLPIFTIKTPLWDDYTLSGSSFDELSRLFKDVGVYNVGMAHFYHWLNVLNGDSVFFGRLLSFMALVSAPVLFYMILDRLEQNFLPKKVLCFLFIVLPFFGACFTEIVVFYIICLDLFLFSIIYFIEYIKFEKTKDLIFYILFVTLSYIINSFVFFIIPAILLVWFVTAKDFKITKKALLLFGVTLGTIIVFMVFKHFFMQVNPNSNYENYNKITLHGLLINGPLKTIKQIPNSITNLYYLALDVLKSTSNVVLILLLTTPFYFSIKKIEWNAISGKTFFFSLIAALILIFSAIYPYAVVGKVNTNMYEYTSRFDMLLIIGFSFIIVAVITFFIKNKTIGKITFSVFFSVLFVCKISVLANFYYQANLQTFLLNSYLSTLDKSKSHFVNEKNNHSINWRFYEIGGALRRNHLPENVFYVSGKSAYFANDTINKTLIQKYIDIKHYSIKDFDVNNFKYHSMEFVYKEKIDIWEYIKMHTSEAPFSYKINEL